MPKLVQFRLTKPGSYIRASTGKALVVHVAPALVTAEAGEFDGDGVEVVTKAKPASKAAPPKKAAKK